MRLAIREIYTSQGGCNMENEEVYFEESNPKRVKILCVILIVIITICFLIFVYYRRTYTLNIKNKVVVELGDKISYDIKDYVENKIVDEEDYVLNLASVSITDDFYDMVGEFTYRVNFKSISKKGKIIVKDTTPPEVVVSDLKIGVDEELIPDAFITSCEDYSHSCTVELKNENDKDISQKAGTYKIDLIISDQYKNAVTKTVNLTVEKGYSYTDACKNDLKIDHLSEKVDDWNGELIIKYDKALDLESLEGDEKYQELISRATSTENNLHIYMPEEYKLNRIDEFEIIVAYNKHDMAVGVAIRVKLDNGKTMYLTK